MSDADDQIGAAATVIAVAPTSGFSGRSEEYDPRGGAFPLGYGAGLPSATAGPGGMSVPDGRQRTTSSTFYHTVKAFVQSLPPQVDNMVSDYRKKVTKENYLLIVSVFGSLVGSVYGYVVTLSGLLLMDSTFLEHMGGGSTTFDLRFILLFYVGEVVGAFFSFLLSDIFGRKTTLVYCAVVCIFLLLWSSLSADGTDLLTARFFLGWGLGLLMAVAPVYTSEVAVGADRGKSIGMIAVTEFTGALLACLMYFALQGYAFGWRVALVLPMLVLAAKACGLLFLPESPRWILAHRTPTECLESMRQLRRTNDVSEEFHVIYQALSSDARLGDSWIEILSSKAIRYRLFVACALQTSHQLLGYEIITTFGSSLLGLLDMHSVLLGLLLAAVSALLGALLGLSKVDAWGRRFLLICGCLSMFCSWLGASVCVYAGGLQEGKAELYFQAYILRFLFGSFLCLFAFSFAFGFESVSWVVAAELFPLRARGRASALTTSCHGASAVLATSFLADWLAGDGDSASSSSIATVILLFACYALCLALFVFIALPETQGLMLEDMEELFDLGGGGNSSSAGCCGCCPEVKAGLMGLRVVGQAGPGGRGTGGVGSARQGAPGKDGTDAGAAQAAERFEPSTLHKYSGGMRETKFEYFTEEEAPLVPSFGSFISGAGVVASGSGTSGAGAAAGASYGTLSTAEASK